VSGPRWRGGSGRLGAGLGGARWAARAHVQHRRHGGVDARYCQASPSPHPHGSSVSRCLEVGAWQAERCSSPRLGLQLTWLLLLIWGRCC